MKYFLAILVVLALSMVSLSLLAEFAAAQAIDGPRGIVLGRGVGINDDGTFMAFRLRVVQPESGVEGGSGSGSGSSSQFKGSIKIFDANGKQKYKLQNIQFSESSLTADIVPKRSGGASPSPGSGGVGYLEFSVARVFKHNIWHGTITLNGVTWTAYLADKHGPVDATATPTEEAATPTPEGG